MPPTGNPMLACTSKLYRQRWSQPSRGETDKIITYYLCQDFPHIQIESYRPPTGILNIRKSFLHYNTFILQKALDTGRLEFPIIVQKSYLLVNLVPLPMLAYKVPYTLRKKYMPGFLIIHIPHYIFGVIYNAWLCTYINDQVFPNCPWYPTYWFDNDT